MFSPIMAKLANLCGARAYINVDRFTDLNSNEFITSPASEVLEKITVHQDMLDFVSKIPTDAQVCFIVSGINTDLIKNINYHQELAKEMTRAAAVDGLILSDHDSLAGHQEGERLSRLGTAFADP